MRTMLANRLVHCVDKGVHKGGRLSNNHRGPQAIEWSPIPRGLIDEVSLTVKGQTAYNARSVAGRSVYRGRMGQARYLELDPSTQLPLASNGTSRAKNLIIELVVNSYGYGDGRIGPTRCALIAGARGDRWSRCQRCRTSPSAVRSTHSALAVRSRRGSTADPGGFPRSRTTRRSASTPCDDASPPRSAPDTRPCPLHPCPF